METLSRHLRGNRAVIMGRRHDDCQVPTLGARVIGPERPGDAVDPSSASAEKVVVISEHEGSGQRRAEPVGAGVG